MKYFILFASILFACISSYSQSWTFKKGGDPFDGQYKTSSVIGKSSNTTYTLPLLVVNSYSNSGNFNIYIGNVGYFCGNVKVKFIFDATERVYYCTASESNKQEVVFLSAFHYFDSKLGKVFISRFEFLDLAKKHSKMHCRLEDDCDKENLEFSLSGSTKAINFVYGDLAADIKAEVARDKAQREEQKKMQEAKKFISAGPAFLKLNSGSKYVILWDTPDVTGKIIGKVYENDTVEVISKDQGYFLIETQDTIIGYVNEGFIYPLVY